MTCSQIAWRIAAVFYWIGLALCSDATAASGRKVALVIGNSAYDHITTLKNPKYDAAIFADRLRDAGFEVTEVFDADTFTMQRAAGRFTTTARDADLALFYYAGHGVQLFDQNYLLARDTDPKRLQKAEDLGLSLSGLADQLRQSGAVRVALLIDACRNNPLPLDVSVRLVTGGSAPAADGAGQASARAATRGLAPLGLAGGNGRAEMLTFFAAQPREVSFDGTGANSILMEGLIEALSGQGADAGKERELSVVIRQASAYVRTITQGRQVPQVVSDWTSDVSLGGNLRARIEYDPMPRDVPLSKEDRALVLKGTAGFSKLRGNFIAQASWNQGIPLNLTDAELARYRALGGNARWMRLHYDLDRDGRDESITVYNERDVVQVVIEKDGVRATISNCRLPNEISALEIGLHDVDGDRRPELFLTYEEGDKEGFGRFCVLAFTGFKDLPAQKRANTGRFDAGTELFRTLLDTEAGWTMTVTIDKTIRRCSGTSCADDTDFIFDGRRFVMKGEAPALVTGVRSASVSGLPLPAGRPPASPSLRSEQVAAFLQATLFRPGLHSREELRALYGTQVDYFGKRALAVDEVLKDKIRYFGQWPDRQFQIEPDTMRVTPDGSDLAVSFQYSYRVAGARRQRSGRGVSEMRLRPIRDDRFIIVSEGGRTI